MGLIDTLRQVEETGEKAVHLGADLVRTAVRNAENRVHRQVRSHRSQAQTGLSHSTQAGPEPKQQSPPTKARTGIVSINGQDVGEMRCTGGRRSG